MPNPAGSKSTYTTRNPALISTLELARLLGAGGNAILKDAGISPSLADNVGTRVSSARLIDAVESAALATARSDFGLLLGSVDDHRGGGPAGLLMEQASTVAEAMELCNRFLQLYRNGWSMVWTGRESKTPILRLDLHTRGKYEPRHFVEGLILETLRRARHFLGADWQPAAVYFKHKQLSPRSVWEHYLGPNARFEQGVIGIKFARAELTRQVPSREPEIRRKLEAMLHDLEAESAADLPEKTAELLRVLLPVRRGSIEEVAEMMGMTSRTLQRRLARHNVKFLDLVATTRLAMAAQCLGERQLSLAQTAPLLGFSEQSALSRFLRRSGGLRTQDLRSRARKPKARRRKRLARDGVRRSIVGVTVN